MIKLWDMYGVIQIEIIFGMIVRSVCIVGFGENHYMNIKTVKAGYKA